jgi:hypothetical protein
VGVRTTMSMVMKMSLKHPKIYSSSPNICEPIRSQHRPNNNPNCKIVLDVKRGRRTRTGNMLKDTTRTRKTDIQTALSTRSPTSQFRKVLPSSYRNLMALDTATNCSPARTA